MILTDDDNTARWLRKARYDGREGKSYPNERIDMLGWHVYMTPEQALQILTEIASKTLLNFQQNDAVKQAIQTLKSVLTKEDKPTES